MKFAYQNGLPLIPIVIKGRTGKISLNAHIDFAASKTLVPQKIGWKKGGNNFFGSVDDLQPN
jgi:hypothetical protein